MTSLPVLVHVWDTTTSSRGALALAGPLTGENTATLQESIETRLSPKTSIRRLYVDCSGVTECDSAGLATLSALRRRANELAIEVDLSASPVLTRSLELTGTAESH